MRWLMTIVLCIAVVPRVAAPAEWRSVEQAYHRADAKQLDRLTSNADPCTAAFAGYRLAVVRERRAPARVDPMLERALDSVERCLTATPNSVSALVVAAAIHGRMAGTGMLAGMRHGPIAADYLERAGKIDAGYPPLWLVRGVSRLHKPDWLGGGARPALEALDAAVVRYIAADEWAWGRAEVHVWRAYAHRRLSDTVIVRDERRQSLEIAPEFDWPRQLLARLDGPGA